MASLRRSKSLLALVILLPLTILFFLALLALQARQSRELQHEIGRLQGQLAYAQEQNEFYKKAYEATLYDIKTLSRIYGGERKYSQEAGRVRAQELAVLFSQNITPERTVIANSNLWKQYQQQGVIQSSCLPQPVPVLGLNEDMLVALAASGSGEELSVYVDGNIVMEFPVFNRTTHVAAIIIPTGVHELTLVTRGRVDVQQLTIDAQRIPVNATVSDSGIGWEVFDCAGLGNDTAFGPGALRMQFERR
jgi:hypothetical protein